MSWFELNFAELPDPRTGNATQHDLMEVLTIALTASIAGAQNCTEFAAFGVDRKDLFDEFLDLNSGIPVTAPSLGCFGCWTRKLSPSVSAGFWRR